MAAPYLDPYIAPFKPLSNISPFTYKDGETYLEVLERMRAYLNDDLVDFINTNFTELGDDFETQVNTLITAVNEAIQAVVESSAETQDAVVAELIEDVASASRLALDTLYAGQVTQSAIAAIVVTGATRAALDVLYAGQGVTNSQVNAIVQTGATKATLDGAYAGQVTNAVIAAIVVTGATKTALDTAYANQTPSNEDIAAIVVTGDTKTALDTAYANQTPSNEDIAAIVVTGDTKTALDGVYVPISGDITDPFNFNAGVLADGRILINTSDGSIVWSSLTQGWILEAALGFQPPAFATADRPEGAAWRLILDIDENALYFTPDGIEWQKIATGDSLGTLSGAGQLAIGNDIVPPSSGWPSITIGSSAENDAPVAIAIGDSTKILGGGSGAGGIAIGDSAEVGATGEAHGGGVAIGNAASVIKTGGSGYGSVAIGPNASVDGAYAVAVGGGASVVGDRGVAIGDGTVTEEYGIGILGTAGGDSATAVGRSSSASGADSVALGRGAQVTGANSVMIGNDTNGDDDTFQIAQEIFKMPNLEITALSSYIPMINDAVIYWPGGLAAHPTGDGLAVGVQYFNTVDGQPYWLKEIGPDVWVDAAGVTVP